MEFGEGAGARKLALLRALDRARLPSRAEVRRLHETLLFVRAYPDDPAVLARVEGMLGRFAARPDLRRHQDALVNSGIAGTEIVSRFYAFAASWMARRWPGRLTIDWPAFDAAPKLDAIFHWLTLYAETPGLDECPFGVREWVARLAGLRVTDAAFLIRRFDALRADPFLRENLYEQLDIPIRLAPGGRTGVGRGPSSRAPHPTPARTHERAPGGRVAFASRPVSRAVPSIARDAALSPGSVRRATRPEARALIDLARAAMIARTRDLDAFTHADARDVRVAAWDDGFRIAFAGMIPERRLLLESVTGYLMLKNGVPVGYGTGSALFGSVEVAYNVFETFRGAEAGRWFGRVLATFRDRFRADAFVVSPYQLGDDNDEALRSGAWWFYRKFGFAPRHAGAARLARREERARRADPTRRSARATLKSLAEHDVFLFLGNPRDDVLGALALGNVGLCVTAFLARRFGADREAASRACDREARARCGVRSLDGWSRGERLAWARWAPLVAALPGIARWSASERRALALVVRAKGGASESEFALTFDEHRRLRRAVRALAVAGPPALAR